jgi:hypothetical protein
MEKSGEGFSKHQKKMSVERLRKTGRFQALWDDNENKG